MSAPAAEIKKGRKFDQVLEGARRVFMRDGFEGASVDEIAREAQVSKATLYSYFPDKRLLFSEVARIECNRQAEEAIEVIGSGAPIEEVLHVAESHRFPELGRRFYASGPALVRERMSKVLAPYVEAGILRIDDMDLAANQFGELCKGDLFVRSLCGMCDAPSEADIERVVNGAVEMFLARYRA